LLLLLQLGFRGIVDDFGDSAMPEHTDEMCRAHIILPRCTQTILLLETILLLDVGLLNTLKSKLLFNAFNASSSRLSFNNIRNIFY